MKKTFSYYFCYQFLIRDQSKSVVFYVLNEAKYLKGTEVAIPVVETALKNMQQR